MESILSYFVVNGRDVMLLVAIFVHADVAQIHLAPVTVQLLHVSVIGASLESFSLKLDEILADRQLRHLTSLVVFRRAQTPVLLRTIGTEKLPACVTGDLGTEKSPNIPEFFKNSYRSKIFNLFSPQEVHIDSCCCSTFDMRVTD